MKYLLVPLLMILVACTHKSEMSEFTSQEILELSQNKHDPRNNWAQTQFSAHVQEPRLMNLLRYSKIQMDNETGTFQLLRDSEAGLIERVIDEEGAPSVLLNGSSEISEAEKEEFRLDEQRNFGYRSFYQLMYGLPMSLTDEVVENMGDPENSTYEDKEVYSIPIELKEAMISKNWELMIASEDYSLVALKLDHSNDPDWPDEIIVFDGEFQFKDIRIPRFRHWYLLDSGEYQGSDIIVRSVD